MVPKKTKTKEDYVTAAAERAERARVEMELLQLDLSGETEALAAAERKITSAQAAERKAKATISAATAERTVIRAAIRLAVEPYLIAGASIEVAAAVTGLSATTLRSRSTESIPETGGDHQSENEYDVER